MYRPQDALPGGTAGAIRQELSVVGLSMSRGGHLIKGTDSGWRLGSILEDEVLSRVDRSIAQAVLEDLARALQPVIP